MSEDSFDDGNEFSLRMLEEIDKINWRSKSILRRISLPLTILRKSLANQHNDSSLRDILSSFADRETLWNHILRNWKEYGPPRTSVFKEALYTGVDENARGALWLKLSETEQLGNIREEFVKFKWLPSNDEVLIGRDVTRTFPNVPKFSELDGRGQKDLFMLLKAYSLHNRSGGYCQGISFIAGILLMEMSVTDAYVALVYIMDSLNLKSLYAKDMSSFQCIIYQFTEILEEQSPDLVNHFRNEDFDLSLFCSYFLTLFSTILPLNIVMELMDVLLSEGIDVIFKAGLALLQMHEIELMKLDMDGIRKYLSEGIRHSEAAKPQKLIGITRNFVLDKKHMKRLEKEFKMKVEAEHEQEDTSLRIENKVLKNVIEKLEMENALLAEKLLDTQVKYREKEQDVKSVRHVSISPNEREIFVRNNRFDSERYLTDHNFRLLAVYQETLESIKAQLEAHIVSCHINHGERDDVRSDEKLMELMRISSLEAEVEKHEMKKYIKKTKARIEFLQNSIAALNRESKDYESRIESMAEQIDQEKKLNIEFKRKIEDQETEIRELKAKSQVQRVENMAAIAILDQKVSELEFELIAIKGLNSVISDSSKE